MTSGLKGPRNPSNRVLPKARYEVITPDYFKAVGTALSGRTRLR